EISAASQEQAAGIDQVNKAVMQMDQGTQQNAALVEEATSASQSMKQQATELLNQVAFFKLEETGHRPVAGGQRGSGAASMLANGKKSSTVSQPVHSVKAVFPSKSTARSQRVSMGSSNGHDRRQRENDFFEEF
ncbi:MAG: hypothetical protein KC594_09365, partial [Nitrospira sp.]|nr:hypothetical protein [Nitrospira sp.]